MSKLITGISTGIHYMSEETRTKARMSAEEAWLELIEQIPSWPDWKILGIFSQVLTWVDELKDEDLQRAVLKTVSASLHERIIDPEDLASLIFMSVNYQYLTSGLREILNAHTKGIIARA